MNAGSLRMPLAAAFATLTAAVCLGPTYLTGRWFLPTAFGVLVVGTGCEVARRAGASRPTVPFGGLAALAAYLLLRYAGDQALFGVVPWTDSVARLGDLGAAGLRDIDRYAAPIGVSPGIELITVAGVGLVALLVDTLAVTWRRAALAGLPLLVLYTVPSAVAPEGVSWVAFSLCGIAFLTLLLTESRERVSRWGRPMRYSVDRANYRPEVETAPLGQVGRRVGATALGLALIVPAALPDLTASSFGFGGGGFGRGSGGGTKVTVINPILELGESLRQGENTPLLRYRGRPTYLRLVGLDEFTGDTWAPSDLKVSRDDNDVENGIVAPPGLSEAVPRTRRGYQVEVFDLDQQWLPLPYPAARVRDIDGTWLYDASTFNVFGENSSTRQIDYRVSALDVAPSAGQLAEAADSTPPALSRYLELPEDMDPVILATAEDVTREAANDYAKAMALQQWLVNPVNFTYSQTVDSAGPGNGNGASAIVAFLQTGRGYCVQFASTMAVMARLLEIPARVAVGFTSGELQPDGTRLVRAHDAHAWPELYFQGVGWLRFEPTPGGPASPRTPAYAQPRQDGATPTDGPSASASPTPTSTATGEAGANPRLREDIFEPSATGGGGIGAGPVRIPVVPFFLGVGALLLLAVPAVTRVLRRRRRWQGAATPTAQALAAWADLLDDLLDHGQVWDPSDPPRRGAARLVDRLHLVGAPAEALHRLASATERARYAPEMTPVGDLHADADTVRAALSEHASRYTRWRARLVPRSTRSVATALADRFADGLDALDTGWAALGTRLRLRRG